MSNTCVCMSSQSLKLSFTHSLTQHEDSYICVHPEQLDISEKSVDDLMQLYLAQLRVPFLQLRVCSAFEALRTRKLGFATSGNTKIYGRWPEQSLNHNLLFCLFVLFVEQ